MNRTRHAAFTIALVALGALSACGDDDDDDTPAPGDTTMTTESMMTEDTTMTTESMMMESTPTTAGG